MGILDFWTCECGTINNDDWTQCADCGADRP